MHAKTCVLGDRWYDRLRVSDGGSQHIPRPIRGATHDQALHPTWTLPDPISVLDDLHLGGCWILAYRTSATAVWRSIILATHPPTTFYS